MLTLSRTPGPSPYVLCLTLTLAPGPFHLDNTFNDSFNNPSTVKACI
jgi:hypothetical protein